MNENSKIKYGKEDNESSSCTYVVHFARRTKCQNKKKIPHIVSYFEGPWLIYLLNDNITCNINETSNVINVGSVHIKNRKEIFHRIMEFCSHEPFSITLEVLTPESKECIFSSFQMRNDNAIVVVQLTNYLIHLNLEIQTHAHNFQLSIQLR